MAASIPVFRISPPVLGHLRAHGPPPLNNRASSSEGVNTPTNLNINGVQNSKYSHLISNILLDIRVATDVCRNLHTRVTELENLINSCENIRVPQYSNQFIANSLPSYHMQSTGNRGEEDGREWHLVTERRKHRIPNTNVPPPPLLPTRNTFDVLADYDGDFPSLDSAAAARFQPNRLHHAPPVRQACIPPLVNNNATGRAPRKVFPPNQLKYSESHCHVLDAPEGYAKAHSVDQTLQMSAGIALDFRNEIGQVQELTAQNKKVGEVAHVKDKNGDHILYMVSKRKHFYKPTKEFESRFKSNYIKALYGLRKTCLQLKIKKLAIPKMGCNCDQLSWENFMGPNIREIFDTVPIEILVCDSNPRTVRIPPRTPHSKPKTPPPAVTQNSPQSPPLDPPPASTLTSVNVLPDQHSDQNSLPPLSPTHPVHNIIRTPEKIPTPHTTSSTSTPTSSMSPLNKLAGLIDKIGVFATSFTPRSNSVEGSPVYTTLTNMQYYTPQDIEPECLDRSYNTTSKNEIHPIPFPLL
ncbi:hypothetical protein B566_EDAN017007 [Ephemera danica]|nr:hypothetical protein B566_EDAN017007 [Ephemera danica]